MATSPLVIIVSIIIQKYIPIDSRRPLWPGALRQLSHLGSLLLRLGSDHSWTRQTSAEL